MQIQKEVPELTIRTSLLLGGHRKEFGSPMELMLEIIGLLMGTYLAEEVVWHMKVLVNKEIEA